MTKAQRRARAKRAGAVRRKANAVKAFMKKMNPGKKAPVAVRVKRLKGGGISVTPLKANAGRGPGGRFKADSPRLRQLKKELRSAQRRARTRLRGGLTRNIAW